MADRALGIHFFVFIVLLLSVKDMLFINNEAASSDKSAVNSNQPINLDPSQEFSSGRGGNDEDKFDSSFDEYSKKKDDDAANQSTSEDRIIDDDEIATYDKKIPSLKMRNNVQTIKFSFCYSCGYRNAFQQYSEMIRARFPEIQIVGENYSPQAYKVYIAQFLSSFKLLVIALILFGQNPFPYVGMPTPAVFEWALQNKLYATLMTFFLSNAIETHLITTGAFEVYLNDIQIWSKLQSDRFPAEKELLQILDVNFNFESEKNTAFGAGAGSMKF